MTRRTVRQITDAADLSSLPDRVLARFESAEADLPPLCVVKLDGKLHALADRCPHRGVPLSDGDLNGTVLTCPAHGLPFDVRSGRSAAGLGEAAAPYGIAVRDGRIVVSRTCRGWFRQWSNRWLRFAGDLANPS